MCFLPFTLPHKWMASLSDFRYSSSYVFGLRKAPRQLLQGRMKPSGWVLAWQREEQLKEAIASALVAKERMVSPARSASPDAWWHPSPCAPWLPPPGGKMSLYRAQTTSWGEHYCFVGQSPVPEEAAVYQLCPHHSTQSVCAVRGIDRVGIAPKTI